MSQSEDYAPQSHGVSKRIDTVNDDIAENYCRERMRINAPGRMTYQRILVRSTNNGGGKTTIPYDIKSDVPLVPRSSILPTTEEQEEALEESSILMLVVGLVIADDPMKFSNGGSVQSKEKERRRTKRGILDRPPNMIRAVIQAAQHSPSSLKFYVAIDAVNGLCGLRLIKKEAIFFFPEFLPSATNTTRKMPIRARQVAISSACRLAAAAISGGEISSEGARTGDQDMTPSMKEPADRAANTTDEITDVSDGTRNIKEEGIEL